MKIYARPDIRISELLQEHPMAYRALLECGMGCVSCPSAMIETIEEACMVHGLDVEDVVDYVNHALNEAEDGAADASGETPGSAYGSSRSGYDGRSLYEASREVAGTGSDGSGSATASAPLEKDMEEKMMDFLDATTYADRIRIFETMKGADDRILNNIAVSMDIMLDDRFDSYERIDYELRFRAKFETVRGDRL